MYKCAVDKFGIDIYTPVELNVEEDLSFKKSISEIGHVGEGVNISCTYPQSHSSDPKFLCRRVGTVSCSYKTLVKESRRWINEGKLYLHDDRSKQIFTVIINSLTEGDSGEYWCGAESDWTSDHGYKVYITQINLRVTATSPSNSTPQITERTFSSSTSTVNSPLKTSAVPASTQSQSLRGSTNDHRVSLCDSEEVKDISTSDAGVSTVYSTAQPPTNPSEPSQTVDDDVQLTSSSDFSNSIYSAAQLPSNSPDQDIYSTAQLHTILSDSLASATQHSAGKSAEGPTYATVNFRQNADSSTDAVTTATINKENDSCDYATVKC
ncbi:CMRF35-like molecule 9 [Colossoma macropomum]|uniref:CMRF35-like molecule 9 n=1 Tax=Colossoma macropomum TaxID=42526 RepID=UPI001864A14E|nr:CMRF35-like molecule 9 [Colossoma macropomum]